MQTRLVTVVIPTFNDNPVHIRQCVNSVLSQSYKNIEVIIVDDGSTSTESVQFLKEINQVKVIHQENHGAARARNVGVNASAGEYILPLDADDWIDPQFVQEGLNCMEAGAVLAHPDWITFGDVVGHRLNPPPIVRLRDELLENYICIATMFRKKDFLEVGGFDESLQQGYEDWELWVRMLTRGNATRLPTALLHYRIRSSSRFWTTERQNALSLTWAAMARNNRRGSLIGPRIRIARGKRWLLRKRHRLLPLMGNRRDQVTGNSK